MKPVTKSEMLSWMEWASFSMEALLGRKTLFRRLFGRKNAYQKNFDEISRTELAILELIGKQP